MTNGDMLKIGSFTIKFEVKKFNSKGNFNLWQKRVKMLLVQQVFIRPCREVSKTCRYVKWGLGEDGSKGVKHNSIISGRQGHVQCDGWRNDYGIVVKVRDIVYDEKSVQQAVSHDKLTNRGVFWNKISVLFRCSVMPDPAGTETLLWHIYLGQKYPHIYTLRISTGKNQSTKVRNVLYIPTYE